jgi:hypothetical protein
MFLLAQHPDVVVCQQNRLFEALAGFRQWFDQMKSGSSEDRFAMSVVLPSEQPEAGEATANFVELLPENEFYAICRNTVAAIYDRIASNKPGAEVVADKTPENARQGEFILKVFPDAYFLHVVRDPRAVTSSVMAAAKSWVNGFPPEVWNAARMWRHDTLKAREIGRKADHYLEIRYESLKADAPGELQRIFSWLGLASDRALCEQAVASSKIDRMKEMTSGIKGFVRKGETDSWRGDLSADDVRVVEYIAGDLMDELGYKREHAAAGGKPMTLAFADARRALRIALQKGPGRLKKRIGSLLRSGGNGKESSA